MKTLIASLLFAFPLCTSAQYSETFDTPNKGILTPPCTSNDPTSCAAFDFTGVNWTIGGDLSGLDNGQAPPDEGVHTSGGVLTTPGGDVDEEVCWISPTLDISLAGSDVDFNVDVTYTGFDASDYLDVEYSIDGGAFLVAQANLVGSSGHTISGASGGISGSQNDVGIAGGLSGNTMTIRVCADFNSSSESFSVDNVMVPDANVTILPVELIDFQARKMDASVKLLWSTALELNNHKFEIQHSAEGRTFITIGEVSGYGSTSEKRHYTFLHDTPAPGINYYRLKQIDFDGRFEHSHIVTVKFESSDFHPISVYPNPSFGGLFNLRIDDASARELRFVVYDQTGLQVRRGVLHHEEGRPETNLNLSSLSSGLYTLKIAFGNVTDHHKLLILNDR